MSASAGTGKQIRYQFNWMFGAKNDLAFYFLPRFHAGNGGRRNQIFDIGPDTVFCFERIVFQALIANEAHYVCDMTGIL